ncbi:hypothetical protein KEM55_000984 [Ascosphaera atra]|nr:hypothetical protein KEM55_000984 [Ascosphaera atra]
MSATADAYLTPVIKEYIHSISKAFIGGLEGAKDTRCEFMQSDGGLADFRNFSGLRAILSGPAGGVVGFAQTSYDSEEDVPIIGFDMGGTSTDGMTPLLPFLRVNPPLVAVPFCLGAMDCSMSARSRLRHTQALLVIERAAHLP